MKRALILLLLLPGIACAQVVINNGTSMAVSGTPDIVINLQGNLSNNSTFDFTGSNLLLNLTTGEQTLTGPLVVSDLSLTGGNNKTINGNLTITHGINFAIGFLRPSTSGKVLYTGAADNLIGASEHSFAHGPFTIRSSGRNFFPIGTDGIGYAPAWMESGNGTDEVAMEVVNTGAALAFDPSASEIQAVDNTRYWQVSSPNLGGPGSQVTLSLNGIASFGSDLAAVVVQADNTGGTAENLQSATTDGVTVTSRRTVTKPVLAIAGSKEIVLRIHDIITPFLNDDMNDELYIEHIESFAVNKVSLLDRWGVPVKEWTNFTNYTDPINPNTDGYDFTKLSPGNYICIVEYGDAETGMSKKSQMITVLKTK